MLHVAKWLSYVINQAISNTVDDNDISGDEHIKKMKLISKYSVILDDRTNLWTLRRQNCGHILNSFDTLTITIEINEMMNIQRKE